jgi:hypothetical protein
MDVDGLYRATADPPLAAGDRTGSRQRAGGRQGREGAQRIEDRASIVQSRLPRRTVSS